MVWNELIYLFLHHQGISVCMPWKLGTEYTETEDKEFNFHCYEIYDFNPFMDNV